jgi:hypothetical protein
LFGSVWAAALGTETAAISAAKRSEARGESRGKREMVLLESTLREIMEYSLRERGLMPEQPVESGVRLEMRGFYHDKQVSIWYRFGLVVIAVFV